MGWITRKKIKRVKIDAQIFEFRLWRNEKIQMERSGMASILTLLIFFRVIHPIFIDQ